MLRAIDSNYPFSDLNPSWKTWIEMEAMIRISYTTIRIPESGVMKNKAMRFESSSYGFEFLSKSKGWRSNKAIRIFELRIRISLGAKFKSHSGDSNPLHSDSSPSAHVSFGSFDPEVQLTVNPSSWPLWHVFDLYFFYISFCFMYLHVFQA